MKRKVPLATKVLPPLEYERKRKAVKRRRAKRKSVRP